MVCWPAIYHGSVLKQVIEWVPGDNPPGDSEDGQFMWRQSNGRNEGRASITPPPTNGFRRLSWANKFRGAALKKIVAPCGANPGRRWFLAASILPLVLPWRGEAATILAATPIARLDLKWWHDRHVAKLEELRRVKPNLIFLGDSITQDWEYDGPEEWRRFAPEWQRFYGDRSAVNLGFKGDTTASLLWRIQNGETDGIAPKVAVILIGANNLGRLHWSASDTLAGIDAIIGELRRRLPATRILLLGVLPSERSLWVTKTTWAINHELEEKYARDSQVTFLDVGHVFMKDGQLNRELFADTVMNPPQPPLHPSPRGQALMSAAMEPVLAGLLGDKPHK